MEDTNYTRPNDSDHTDSPQDWLNGALAFARAISFLLEEDEGIVIEPIGEMSEYFGKDKLIIANVQHQIHIIPMSSITKDDIKEGEIIKLISENEPGE